MYKVDEKLYQAACDFLDARFGGQSWQGVAAMYTESGKILLSTAPEVVNDSVSLCHETGAICEAYKINEAIAASICISRDDKGDVHILSPCGVCQERLYLYGAGVSVAVPIDGDSTKWQAKTLGEIQPFYWRRPFIE
ncbi:MAG: cytidine deaminase [Alphaproteobacteria bacterium]|nr:cytidine deaminase [Alphaproteobacteria bacterium]